MDDFAFFKSGLGFYAEYNIRLFFFLLITKADLICCIDLDTMLPVWLVSKLKGNKKVYDAHEYFSQQKEIITRPRVHTVWKWIEKTFVPTFKIGYTVSQGIANEFKKQFNVKYEVIRNLPLQKDLPPQFYNKEKIILYQGAINEARGFEFLIPAMKNIDAVLHIYGDGNYFTQTQNLIVANNLQNKVFLKGKVLPHDLDAVTQQAYIGLNLVENNGQNQYHSLANKFFDYIINEIPQVSMNFPEYKNINDEFEVAVLINDLQPEKISAAINKLLTDDEFYLKLSKNCIQAGNVLNWQQEEKKLLNFYNAII
ncbi:MAG TPA: glycosyltransferase [Ferruginibacter sp.]|nr:glycosyltransferase [Ferruginibacter sp.]